MQRYLTTFLCVFLIAVEAAAGSRLLNYENRVVSAAEQIERIKADPEYSDEGIAFIKQRLPRSEKINFEGREVTVDNNWLHEMLDSYASEKDPQQKIAKLNDLSGRLRSLDEHLRRAEVDDTGNTGDAGERIREILSRPAYQPEPESPIGAFLKKVLRKIREFLGGIYSALTRLLERLLGAGAGSGWIGNALLVVILLLGVLVAVRFGRKIRRPQGKRKKTRVVLGEEVALDSTSRDLAEAALAAARAGDFRTAVRKLYVSLLYELSERGLIELEDSATNHEYLRKAARFAGVAAPMRYLTDRFDYVWYGMLPTSEDDFADYMARYLEAMENVRIVNQ
jgi:Domain of unknown function (DUF4129)